MGFVKKYHILIAIYCYIFSGYRVEGIHKENPLQAVEKAEAIFVGGGNTFRLLKTLYDLNLVKAVRKMVLNNGIPYIGTSAGKFNI